MTQIYDAALAAAVRRSLGTCLVIGGCGFMGSHIVSQLVQLAKSRGEVEENEMTIHVLDVTPPRKAFEEVFQHVSFHRASITDTDAMRKLFEVLNPDSVFHAASIIDLRPYPVPSLDQINVEATRSLLELSKESSLCNDKLTKFVYTSTIECGYSNNECINVDETMPYPSKPSNGYQRTKIEAEKLVLAANDGESGLKTAALRPAHIFGQGDDLFILGSVPVCFGKGTPETGKAAPMGMVDVENCAFAHIIAAALLSPGPKQALVEGRTFYVSDFSQNIICLYHELTGAPPPPINLPYWSLALMVHSAIWLSIILYKLFCGFQLLQPKTGLHDGALAAGLTTTVNSSRARRILGYRSFVPKSTTLTACRKWWEQPTKTVADKRVYPQLNPLEHLDVLAQS